MRKGVTSESAADAVQEGRPCPGACSCEGHAVRACRVFSIGGERAAGVLSLIQTVRLNDLDPACYPRDALTRMADHPINRIADLLSWNVTITA